MKVAILLTTFNRKEKTIACLKSIKSQSLGNNVSTHIILTDDASSDGTANAVRMSFPDVEILEGNGSLFWAGGMRNSWRHALKGNFSHYLLINDDTTLKQDALQKLIDHSLRSEKPSISIGSTSDSKTGELSYGGRKLVTRFSLKSELVFSESEVIECDLGNANIMLVPNEVVQKVGILSDQFTHGIADYDYTLNAKRNGFVVEVVPGILGNCIDDHGNNWMPQRTKIADRIKYLKSPKGLAYHEYMGFVKDHFPLYYPLAFTKLWLKTLFPFLWQTLKLKA